jgi:hypothetical protein
MRRLPLAGHSDDRRAHVLGLYHQHAVQTVLQQMDDVGALHGVVWACSVAARDFPQRLVAGFRNRVRARGHTTAARVMV